jgi:hypothetical protein
MEIGFGIGGAPLLRVFFQSLYDIPAHQKRAGVAPPDTLREHPHLGVEPDGDSSGFDIASRLRIKKSAATESQHLPRLVQQARDDSPFGGAKSFLAERSENFGNAHSRGVLDGAIGVDERAPEPFSEPPSDCCFTCAHHAHKDKRSVAKQAQ